jgi:hypothetical protein
MDHRNFKRYFFAYSKLKWLCNQFKLMDAHVGNVLAAYCYLLEWNFCDKLYARRNSIIQTAFRSLAEQERHNYRRIDWNFVDT